MSQPTVAPLVIDRDCPCVGCGYNLRTLRSDAWCPECAKSVTHTVSEHAMRLPGADPRWLHAVASAMIWLTLAVLIPVLVPLHQWPSADLGPWLTADRVRLAVVLTPAVLAIAACWRMGTRRRDMAASDPYDQPYTRWGLRLAAAAYPVPLLWIAGPFDYPQRQGWGSEILGLLWFTWIPATFLFFRRLNRVARATRSTFLLRQCLVIGVQLPFAPYFLAHVPHPSSRWVPDAFRYLTNVPVPLIGLPWFVAIESANWIHWFPHVEFFIVAWTVGLAIGTLCVVLQVLVRLLLIRQQDQTLPAYCRKLLEHGRLQ